jgi:hypothetical protein
MNLINVTLAGALTGQLSAVYQLRDVKSYPVNVLAMASLTFVGGGTSADAYLQTSLDGGTSWCDVANWHFLVASAKFVYNLSSLTPVTTQYAPLDGALAANTAKDGIIGSHWRVKWTSVGTYTGATILRVDVNTSRLVPAT